MILQTKDLTKTYQRQGQQFDAVSHVTFSMEKGEMVVLTGPSGCGKSTFFHLISGITVPDSGEIIFDGEKITSLTPQQKTTLRASKISYILQGDSLLPNFTVLENICLPHQLSNVTNPEELSTKAMELIQEFGLEKLTNDYPTNLSGGERRRVAIARAFVHNPLMVVADEPTSDLDEENTKIILDYFQKQSSLGKSILISTHELSCLRPGVTHYIMRKGSMKFENHIESLAKN